MLASLHRQDLTSSDAQLKYFVCGTDYNEISGVLQRLTEECEICCGPKMCICLEKMSCCGIRLFCYCCEREEHRWHRLNELAMAFVDQSAIRNGYSQVSLVAKIVKTLESTKFRVHKQIQAMSNKAVRHKFMLSQINSLKGQLARICELIEWYKREGGNPMRNELADAAIEVVQTAVELSRTSPFEGRTDLVQQRRERWRSLRQRFITNITNIRFDSPQRKEKPEIHPSQNPRSTTPGSYYITPFTSQDDVKGFEQLYQRNLISFLHDTALGRFVNKKWHHLQIPIGHMRAAYLSPPELLQCHELPSRLQFKGAVTDRNIQLWPWKLTSLNININAPLLLPDTLKQLTMSYCPGVQLPKTLHKLSLGYTKRHGSSSNTQYQHLLEQLGTLPSLRHLEIKHEGKIDSAIAKLLVRLGLNQNLRVLILRDKPSIYELRIRAQPVQFNRLNELGLSHQRKVLQGFLMQRSPFLRDSYFREFVLDASELEAQSTSFSGPRVASSPKRVTDGQELRTAVARNWYEEYNYEDDDYDYYNYDNYEGYDDDDEERYGRHW